MPMFKHRCVVLLLISASACAGGSSPRSADTDHDEFRDTLRWFLA